MINETIITIIISSSSFRHTVVMVIVIIVIVVDEDFVIFRITKVEAGVISRSRRVRLITLTEKK